MLLAGKGLGGGVFDGADIGIAHHARRKALDNLQLLGRDLHGLEVRGVSADQLRADDQRLEAEDMADDIAMHPAEIAPGHDAIAYLHVIGAKDAGHD